MNSTYSDKAEGSGLSRVISIELLGVSFSIRTDESPEYIQGLVAELKDRYARLSSGGKAVDPLKLAILTNLLTLDEMRRSPPAAAAKKEGAYTGSLLEQGAGRGAHQARETNRDFEASSLLASLDKKLGDLGL